MSMKRVYAAGVTRELRKNGHPKISGRDGTYGDTKVYYYMSGEFTADAVERTLLSLGYVIERQRWFSEVTNREQASSVIHVLGRNVK